MAEIKPSEVARRTDQLGVGNTVTNLDAVAIAIADAQVELPLRYPNYDFTLVDDPKIRLSIINWALHLLVERQVIKIVITENTSMAKRIYAGSVTTGKKPSPYYQEVERLLGDPLMFVNI